MEVLIVLWLPPNTKASMVAAHVALIDGHQPFEGIVLHMVVHLGIKLQVVRGEATASSLLAPRVGAIARDPIPVSSALGRTEGRLFAGALALDYEASTYCLVGVRMRS